MNVTTQKWKQKNSEFFLIVIPIDSGYLQFLYVVSIKFTKNIIWWVICMKTQLLPYKVIL